MKLAISNIAWDKNDDKIIYELMHKYGFTGLEIAPTRVFPDNPYSHLDEAYEWICEIKQKYGFVVPSMQSIWYGISNKVFGDKEDRDYLVSYSKRAIDFASKIGCSNLVFGSPKNRCIPNELSKGKVAEIENSFWGEIAKYAASKDTYFAIEANPVIYNTNYINYSIEAFELVRNVTNTGLAVNYDLGCVIYNSEDLKVLEDNISLVNHIHISEPGLATIAKRDLHDKLSKMLYELDYQNYVSIEMSKVEDLKIVEDVMSYVAEVFR